MSTSDSATMTRWWGQFSVDEDQRGVWRVGPLTLGVRRSAREWRIERRSDPAASGLECRVTLPSDEAIEGDGTIVGRFSFGRTSDSLWLTPRLADRAVVMSPESAFYVPAGQHIVLYCSTPLWVRVEVGEARAVLEEFPAIRPPDTWFGPSTRQGELCYATKTAARLRREDLVPHPHRAFTELRIQNEADDTLQIERLNVSVPHLSLYRSATGGFWTDSVTLHRTPGENLDELEIGAGAPDDLRAQRVSGPRVESKHTVMMRAFHALFS